MAPVSGLNALPSWSAYCGGGAGSGRGGGLDDNQPGCGSNVVVEGLLHVAGTGTMLGMGWSGMTTAGRVGAGAGMFVGMNGFGGS